MILASAGGNRVPVIAQLVQAHEDTVGDVIHGSTRSAWPAWIRWAGGRLRLVTPDDEDFVIRTATSHPTKLSRAFTRWSVRKLAARLRHGHGRVIRIGCEALRRLLRHRMPELQDDRAEGSRPPPPSMAALVTCFSASTSVPTHSRGRKAAAATRERSTSITAGPAKRSPGSTVPASRSRHRRLAAQPGARTRRLSSRSAA